MNEKMRAAERDLCARAKLTFSTGASVWAEGENVVSFTVREGADSPLLPGNVLCAEYELELANDDGQWRLGGALRGNRPLLGATAELFVRCGGEDAACGVFVVDEVRMEERGGTVHLCGGDSIGSEMAAEFQDELSYPATLSQIWAALVAQTRYEWDGELPNGAAIVDALPEWNGASLRRAAGWIAQAAGCFSCRCCPDGQSSLKSRHLPLRSPSYFFCLLSAPDSIYTAVRFPSRSQHRISSADFSAALSPVWYFIGYPHPFFGGCSACFSSGAVSAQFCCGRRNSGRCCHRNLIRLRHRRRLSAYLMADHCTGHGAADRLRHQSVLFSVLCAARAGLSRAQSSDCPARTVVVCAFRLPRLPAGIPSRLQRLVRSFAPCLRCPAACARYTGAVSQKEEKRMIPSPKNDPAISVDNSTNLAYTEIVDLSTNRS